MSKFAIFFISLQNKGYEIESLETLNFQGEKCLLRIRWLNILRKLERFLLTFMYWII